MICMEEILLEILGKPQLTTKQNASENNSNNSNSRHSDYGTVANKQLVNYSY